jgi:RAT1-interacting protein
LARLHRWLGYKFETLSLLPEPWGLTSRDYIEDREEMIVNNHAQYCSVVKTGIGKARMIIGGEVDAGKKHILYYNYLVLIINTVWDCKPENKDEPINWVELKTSAIIENDRDMLKYERKLMKFWIQSFLLGVPKIIVGFRSKMGILQSLEEVDTQRIPGMVKRGKGTWDGNLCINFTAAFLDCTSPMLAKSLRANGFVGLKQTIATDGLWRIRRRDRSSVIEVIRLGEGTGEILSNEFIEWRSRKID